MATATAGTLTRRRSRTSATAQIFRVLAAFMLGFPSEAASSALTPNAHIGAALEEPQMLEVNAYHKGPDFELHLVAPKASSEEYVRLLAEQKLLEQGLFDPRFVATISGKFVSMKQGYDRTHFGFEVQGRSIFEEHLRELTSTSTERAISVLEIGSDEGGSAIWFAENLLNHPDSRLLCLDSWEATPEMLTSGMNYAEAEVRFRHNMARVRNRDRVQAIKGDSMLSLTGLIASGQSHSFDVVYVDGSHQLADVLADGRLAFRLLKVGGMIIFDDEGAAGDVAKATALLEQAFGDSMQVLYRKEQLVAKKLDDQRGASTSTKLVAIHEHGDVPLGVCPSVSREMFPDRAAGIVDTALDRLL